MLQAYGVDAAQLQQQGGHIHGGTAPHAPVQEPVATQAREAAASPVVVAQGHSHTTSGTQQRMEVDHGAQPGRRYPNIQVGDGGKYLHS